MTRISILALVASVAAGAVASSPVVAQGYTPPPVSYGYQAYDDRNPTGFNHANNMGFGHYVYSPKVTGHRSPSLGYRRFRGY